MVAELGSLLAFAALKNDGRVGLVLFSDRLELYVPPRRGRTQVLRLVRELLTHEIQGVGTQWSAGLEFVNRVLRRRSVVFLLSDFLVPPDGRLFRITGRKHDFIGMWVEDPRETELPKVGWVELEDLETGRRRAVNTNNHRVREAYRVARSEAKRRTVQTLQSSHLDHVQLSTATSYLPPLLRYFSERRRRR